MPWATIRMAQLLSCQKSTAALTPECPEAQPKGATGGHEEVEVDELVTVGESISLGPFQTEIIKGHDKPLFRDMITMLKAEGQPWGSNLLPLGLHVLHAYTHLQTAAV